MQHGRLNEMARGAAASEPPAHESTDSRRRSVARGRYDRAATPSERARMQRARLLEAVRIAGADGGELTVARLLAHVGCGRNTFYEHFDDTSAALSQACVEAQHSCRSLLARHSRSNAHAHRVTQWVMSPTRGPPGVSSTSVHTGPCSNASLAIESTRSCTPPLHTVVRFWSRLVRPPARLGRRVLTRPVGHCARSPAVFIRDSHTA